MESNINWIKVFVNAIHKRELSLALVVLINAKLDMFTLVEFKNAPYAPFFFLTVLIVNSLIKHINAWTVMLDFLKMEIFV